MGERPIELRSVRVRAVINGIHAQTSQTLTFFNPNRRDLEGSLEFPMPDGAVVCGYALDIDGRMIDGVVVPKQKARRVLEAEERKGADPGLVEQVQGNVYRTRIYPIPGGGTRTVTITYVSELNIQGDDAGYHLPLAHANAVAPVDLRVEVVQAPVEPVLSGGIGNLSLNRLEQRWVAEAKLPVGTAGEDLQVRLPKLPGRFRCVEKRVGDGAFFCISERLSEAMTSDTKWSPRRLAIAWDGSGSRQSSAHELALLKLLFKRWGSLTVDLVVVRNTVAATQRFIVQDGRCDELIAHLEALAYDGGTNLAALDLTSTPHADDDAWLVFSDGQGTVGRGISKIGGVRVYCVNSQANSNSVALQHIANASGGYYVNLLRTKPDVAAEQILRHEPGLRVIGTQGCDSIHTHTSQGRLTILGRLQDPVARVELAGPKGQTTVVIEADDRCPTGELLARAWAGLEVAALGQTGDEHAEQTVLKLGQDYGLVTPGSSLIVLERLEQYLEYDIEPPATWPEVHSSWHTQKRLDATQTHQRHTKQIEQVLAMWRARVQWWETDFRDQWPRSGSRGGKGSGGMVDESPRLARPAPSSEVLASLSESVVNPEEEAFAAAPMDAMDFDDEDTAAPLMDAMEAEPMLRSPAPRRARAMSRNVAEAKKEDDKPEGGATQATIRIQPWSPDTPYLTRMKEADDAYLAYLKARPDYVASPAFYLDCGDFLLARGQRAEGLRVLSNLVELGLRDAALMRMYAWRLGQAGELDTAVDVLEQVRNDRDDEPQSHRDLALMLGERWQKNRNPEDATRAMILLYDVILRTWDRFPEIELIALMELNRLIHLTRAYDIPTPERIDPRLVQLLDLDIRISMSWDADLTDVDLHVYEPTGEHAYYAHNRTQIGGVVSRDFTQGYGPEEYVLRHAYPGKYTIKAHYYGSSQQTLTGPCTVIVTVYTNYGREDENKQVLTLRLERPRDEVTVGEISIEGTLEQRTGGFPNWRERFEKLTRDMTLDEITGRVGQPASIGGGDVMTMIYRPATGSPLRSTSAPAFSESWPKSTAPNSSLCNSSVDPSIKND